MKNKKKKVGKPRKGNEVRKVSSVRIEPTVKLLLIKRYGSFQAAIDKLVTDDLNKVIRGE